ncbi:MAG: hypothetical protein VB032_09180 [Burkholderiaceae bacterium]|nr:hypothetical protein [Burkholderiaceae bacterium]
MRHIEIIIPFGLPPAKMAAALIRELRTPALATLVARANAAPRLPEFGPQARVLPHGAWLAYQFGLTADFEQNNSPPIATASMQLLGQTPDHGVWFILNPVNIQVGANQILLSDQRHLNLSDKESHLLFEVAKPCFDAANKTLLYGSNTVWFVRADDWKALRTSTPDAACGRNLIPWMPQGEMATEWNRLHNEVQMLWHQHPINAAREQRGLEPVNALWLWGGASGALPTLPAITPYIATYNLSGWISTFGHFAEENNTNCSAADLIASAPERSLLLIDNLIAPALARDWPQWLNVFHKLEKLWFAPLLAALEEQKIDRLTLHLSHDTSLASFASDRQTLRKFWLRKSLARLKQ